MLKILKQHYEKVILSAVLLGAVVVVAMLPSKITAEQEYLENLAQQNLRKSARPLPEFSFSGGEEAVARCQNPIPINFSTEPLHNLINPMPWDRLPDGRPQRQPPRADRGIHKVEITKIYPLYTTISLESVSTAEGVKYLLKTERETETNPRARTKSMFVTAGGKADHFLLREVVGPPDRPEQLVIEMLDTRERGTLTAAKPFKRVDGYMVDLKYEVGAAKKVFTRQRQNMDLRDIEGETYTILAINHIAEDRYEIVFSAKQTQRKTTVTFKAPES